MRQNFLINVDYKNCFMPDFNSSTCRFGFNSMACPPFWWEKIEETETMDFGARLLDGDLGVWLALDPLMVKYPGMSPYNFCANNPILFVDYDGRDFGIVIDHSNKTITITATVYTINQKTQNEAQNAANNWNSLSGNSVLIDGVCFDVQIRITPILADGNNEKERFNNAYNEATKMGSFANTYNGYINSDPRSSKFGKRNSKAMTKNENDIGEDRHVGFTYDWKFVSMILWNIDNAIKYGPNDKPNSVEHEFGHLLGLDDEGGEYYTPGGVMDYNGPFSPNINDVINVIKNALDPNKNGNVKLEQYINNSDEDNYKEIKSSDVGK